MSTTTQAPPLVTTGQIAARFGVATHRIEYLILSRGIRPSLRVGRYRVFDEAAVERIGDELRREGGVGEIPHP